jgi:hypothetical protein
VATGKSQDKQTAVKEVIKYVEKAVPEGQVVIAGKTYQINMTALLDTHDKIQRKWIQYFRGPLAAADSLSKILTISADEARTLLAAHAPKL